MENFESAIGATEAALNSEGSAAAENEKRMDSLQGKVTQLNAAWQEFSINTIDSKAIKSILSLGTGIIKLADTDIGRLIIQLAAAKISIDLFNKALASKKAISFGNALKTGIITNVNAMSVAFKTGATNGTIFSGVLNVLKGGFKGLGAAISANPIFTVITAFTILKTVIDKVQEAQEKERTEAQNLADNYSKQANEGEKLLQTYNDLSSQTDLSTEETKELSDAITKLSKDYGVSTDSLMKEGEERDNAIKKIQDEIDKRKKLAATSAEGTVDWKGGEEDLFKSRGLVTIEGTEELKKQYEQATEISKKLLAPEAKIAAKYDLTADSVAELQQKLHGYITDLENVTNKTQEQKYAQQVLSEWYDKVTESVDKADKGYSQAFENLKEGIPITQEQATVLYNLGEITRSDLGSIEAYYKWQEKSKDATEEQKDTVWDAITAGLSFNEVQQQIVENEKENVSSLSDLSTKIDEEQTAYNSLASAVDEYNNSGYLSVDTLQSLLSLDDQYLSLLSMENGQLVLNTQAMDDMIAALIAKKQEELQSAAITDIMTIANEGAADSANVAAEAAKNAGNNAEESGNNASKGASGWLQYAAAVEQAAATEGAGKDEETQKRIQARLDEYKATAQTISQLGVNFGKGGYASGGGHRYTGSDKDKKGSSKSSKDEYKATIDNLYNYENALDNAKESVDKLKDSLDDTDSYEDQEKYIRQLIDALNNQINKTNDLKKAQTDQINDYINQLRAQGFIIDYNAKKNELYINNMQHLADFSGDTAKNLEKLIKKIQDLNSDNRSLDGSVRDLTGDIKDYYKQLADIPEEKLKKFNDLMEKFQQSRLDQVQAQVDDLQHEMENDPRLKAIEDQIDALENQNDELDKQKQLDEKILAVEQAKEKLANANRQRNIQLYTEDEGWIWTADVDSIKEAAEDLKDAQDDLNDKIKQDQIDQLKAEKEALEKSYQDRIDALENFLDEQNYQIDKANREGIKSFQELQNEMAKYGINSAEYLSKATEWLNNYNQALQQVQNTVQNITSPQAQNNVIYSSAVQDRLAQALSSTIPVAVQTGLQLSQVNYNKPTDNNKGDIYIENIQLPNVRDVDDFVEALKDLPRIATTISAGRK